MAIPYATDTQGQQADTEVARPRGRSVREQFNDLPQQLKDKILEDHRDINTHHDWWECVYEGFISDMKDVGIEVDRMYFSGFWSQGDGACFDGKVCDWETFLTTWHFNDLTLIAHAELAFDFRVRHSGRYYHENCTSFDADLPLPDDSEDTYFTQDHSPFEHDSLHEAVWLTNLNQYSSRNLETEFKDIFKDYMCDLYQRLESEYESLTSDECVLESLYDNDMLEEAIESVLENEYA